jgi:hypothetical protein
MLRFPIKKGLQKKYTELYEAAKQKKDYFSLFSQLEERIHRMLVTL